MDKGSSEGKDALAGKVGLVGLVTGLAFILLTIWVLV